MSRREEVDVLIMDARLEYTDGDALTETTKIAKSLADEVDERDAVITKLLAILEPKGDDERLWQCHGLECGWIGPKKDTVSSPPRRALFPPSQLCPKCNHWAVKIYNQELLDHELYARACEIAGRKE